MIKAIIFDADGVVFYKRDKYFSQRLSENYHVPIDKILPFFKNEYKLCVIGKADLKKELFKYLHDWDWNKSVEELLKYWFSYENKIDNRILNLIKKLRKKGIKCFIASDHSKYRADDLMKNIGLGRYFDGSFFSAYLGCTKEEEEFFKKVIQKLSTLKPEEVLFIDDEKENIKVAQKAGLQTKLYQSFKNLKCELDNL